MAQLVDRRQEAAASSEGKGNLSASSSMTGVPCRHRCPTELRPAAAAPSSRPSKGKGNRSASPSMTGAPCRHRDTMGLRPAPAAPSSRPSKGKGNRSASPSMTGVLGRHLDPTGLRPVAAATSSRPSKGKGNCSASPAMTGISGRHREPMVAAVAPCTESCPKGVSTFPAFDQLRRLEREETKVVQLEMLKSKYETPAYLEEIIAFVNTLLVAHQYFDFKDYLRAFCGLDKDYYFCREPVLESSKTETIAKKVENVTSKLTEACRKYYLLSCYCENLSEAMTCRRYYLLSCYCENLSEAMNAAKGSGIPATDANDKDAKGPQGECS